MTPRKKKKTNNKFMNSYVSLYCMKYLDKTKSKIETNTKNDTHKYSAKCNLVENAFVTNLQPTSAAIYHIWTKRRAHTRSYFWM